MSSQPQYDCPESSPVDPLYIHDALTKSTTFRLLVVKPGHSAEKLYCDLIATDLSDEVRYEALSYVWESPALTKVIFIRNAAFRVTTSLFTALQRFRLPHSSRTLWADAICINQQDKDELGRQVSIMSQIYSNATRVLLWLGEETENAGIVFDFLKNFDPVGRDEQEAPMLDISDAGVVRDLQLSTASSIALTNSIHALLLATWFSRSWVVQEIAVSKHARIICGRFECDWKALIELKGWLDVQRLAPSMPSRADLTMMFIDQFQKPCKTCSRRHNVSSLNTLEYFRGCKASDPRDHIYAFLGLTSETELYPDYSRSCEETFLAYALCHLEHHPFELLHQVRMPTHEPKFKLPSWVPDWTADLGIYNSSWPRAKEYFTHFDTVLNVRHVQATQSLLIEGYVLDRVLRVSNRRFPTREDRPLHRSSTTEFEMWCLVKEVVVDLEDFVDRAGLCLNDEYFQEAYSRLLVFDQYPMAVKSAGSKYNLTTIYRAARRVIDFAEEGLIDEPFVVGVDMEHELYNLATIYNKICGCDVGDLMAVTETGYLGWVPPSVLPGDVVCIFSGMPIPFVLRELGEGDYKLVGSCYIQGIMDGEALEKGTLKPRDFKIL